MPQLNPAPWLLTLVFTWFVFLVVVFPKILPHHMPLQPAPATAKETTTTTWTWPWR